MPVNDPQLAEMRAVLRLINVRLDILSHQQEGMMASMAEIKTAVDNLAVRVSEFIGAADDLLAKYIAALQAADPAAAEQVKVKLDAMSANIQAEIAKITG